jgi:hypothetical protein
MPSSTKRLRNGSKAGAIELSLRLVNDRRTNLRVRSINGYFQRVSPLHNAYAPLHYVLLFLGGRNGWHDDIPLNGF